MRPPVHGIDSRESAVGPGRTWITRRGPKVDRISSAWLIKRFIDPDERFGFVDPAAYSHAAGDLRFDDPALRALSEIVHDLDCKDEKFGRAEVAGVAAIIDGIVLHFRSRPS